MKKLIYIVGLLLLFSYSVSAQETYVPDDNFEAYLEANGMGNGVANDNYVTTANISSRTSLNVDNQGISDLTGIEDFQSLTVLVVSNNNISSIDLSNKTSLTLLFLQDNPLTSIDVSDLTSLTNLDLSRTSVSSLDVSNNAALQSLRLIRCTVLSSIDVSSNTALTLLHLAETASITSVDLKNNPNLTALYLFRSNIETVDLKNGNNTAISAFLANDAHNLTCINVDDAAYSMANWTFIDDSSVFSEGCFGTYVPDDNFEAYLEANGMGNGIANDEYVTTANISSVTSLDVSSQNISDLTGIEAFTALETLVANDNSINTIDLSSNTALKEVNLNNTSISNLDVTLLNSLETLIASSTSISSIDLSNNSALKTVNLSQTNLTSIDLSNNLNLEEIFLIGISSMSTINIKNGNNTNITSFSAILTTVGCINVDNHSYAITNWSANVVSSDTFSERCFETYVPDDNFENYLETHDANGNIVPVGDPTSMGNGVANDNYVPTSAIASVTTLSMLNTNLADLTGIEDFTALTELDVSSGNNIVINIDVSNLTSLEILNISNNSSITSLDISGNTALKQLGISGTNITNLDISFNTVLETLTMRNTGITSLNLSTHTALTYLNIGNNNIPTLDLTNNTALTEFYADNAGLTSLNIKSGSNTNITAFNTTSNSGLVCITVDDAGYSTSNWTTIDATTGFSNTTSCATTSIPNNNFEAYLEANGMGNSIANDNLVFTGNISGVTSLDISGQNITDLTGIAAFTSLTTLNVSSNTSLSSIDVSTLTSLGNLDISSTGISSLDLTGNTALTVLNAQNAALTSLNIKNGANTNITSFNTIGNAGLECIQVDDINYSTTNWTNIDGTTSFSDLCGFTYVPDDNFEGYLETHDANNNLVPIGDPTSMGNGVADDNYVLTSKIETVTSLFIPSQNIYDLTGIEDFSALRSLWVDDNHLTSLDVSNNTNLIDLDCNSNSLTSLNVSTLTSLTTLIVSNMTGITSIDISNNTGLFYLDVSNTGINSLDLKTHTSLTYLDANSSQLTFLDLRNGNNTNMNTVRIHSNIDLTCVSVDDVDYATNNWGPIAGEYSLSCGETYVPDDNFEMYLETHNSSGQTVPMGDANSLGNGSMDNFVTTSKLEFVSNLDIRSRNITDLTGIEDFVYLLELNVIGNPITNLILPTEATYTKLYLGSTSLTSLDVTNFSFLRTLDISNTSISSIDVSNNTALEELFLGSTPISTLNVSANTALKTLDLYDGSITSLDLRSNTALTTLSATDGVLESLDLRNGNNTNISYFNVQLNFNLNCIQVDDADYSNTNWTNIDAHASFGEDGCGIEVSAKVLLQGPYDSGVSLMRDDLRSGGYLPSTSPYADAITVDANVFNTTGSNAIVDWVYVELRDKNDISNVLYATSALLQRDGDVVTTDGVSAVTFEASSDDYYVAISHRNHIAVATSAVVALSGTTTAVDFTNNLSTIKGGALAVSQVDDGVYAMVAGDANANGNIQTTDISPIVQAIGALGYNIHDINLNGAVQTTDTPIALSLVGKIKQF